MKVIGICIFFLLSVLHLSAQTGNAFLYQTVVRGQDGLPKTNQAVSFRIGFYQNSLPNELYWEETHNLMTDNFGRVVLVLGNGNSTAAGSKNNLFEIPWRTQLIDLKTECDSIGGSNFVLLGTSNFNSQPYVLTADSVDSIFPFLSLGNLIDMDSTNWASGNTILFNGINFYSGIIPISDTVLFAYNSAQASTSDSAVFVNDFLIDSVLFSFNTSYVANSNQSIYADSSIYSSNTDSANFAYFYNANSWILTGNSSANGLFVGTIDSVNFCFGTNGNKVLTILPDGTVRLLNATTNAGLNLNTTIGFLSQGTLNTGNHPYDTTSVKLVWSPNRSAFRVGSASGSVTDSLSTGIYSFTTGKDNLSGEYSFAMGNNNVATGDNAVSFGLNNSATANGAGGNGTSFSMGENCNTSGIRTVCIGRNNLTTNTTAVAIGTNASGTGNVTTALGNNVTASANFSTAMGSYVSSANRLGGFIWGDRSTTTVLSPSANYMFVVRADGGIMFYTDAANTMGVVLAPGSGSWASVSDSTLKTNVQILNYETMLAKLTSVPVYTWYYQSQPDVLHIGPMAQDFYKVFQMSDNEKTITSSDIDGVVMICIQGVYYRIEKFEKTFLKADLENGIQNLEQNQSDQSDRLNALENILKNK